MDKPKEEFIRLRNALTEEVELQPKGRNQDYRGRTLDHFKKHGLSQEDHDLWRESKMLDDMLRIMDCRFNALNPHALRIKTMERETDWNSLYAYTEEVDDTGKTLAQIDAERKVLYPAVDRQSLELLAAERFTNARCNAEKKTEPITPGKREISASGEDPNKNPMLTYKRLVEEWKSKHAHYTQGAIQKAIERSIKENINQRDCPWPIDGCGSGYEIAKAPPRKGKEHPTPASCLYRRI